jgi:hypothetical protein
VTTGATSSIGLGGSSGWSAWVETELAYLWGKMEGIKGFEAGLRPPLFTPMLAEGLALPATGKRYFVTARNLGRIGLTIGLTGSPNAF